MNDLMGMAVEVLAAAVKENSKNIAKTMLMSGLGLIFLGGAVYLQDKEIKQLRGRTKALETKLDHLLEPVYDDEGVVK